MDFAALVLSLVLYYIRPQEWMMFLQPFKPVTLVMALAVVSVFMRTGLSWRQLFKTPHDWLVLIYCVWIVVASPDRSGTFHSVYPLFLFYIVAVQALTNFERVIRFLAVWTWMIIAVAGLALLSQHGFDPTGAYDLTNFRMKGRLVLGTSIFKNPNSLGHSVVPAVLMIYFMFIWKRPIFVRIGSLPLFFIPLYCIFMTASKGAFLSGFATAVAAMTFGRPKIVQIGILIFAMTTGWATVQMLPRMQEMKRTQSDEAIQGRVLAFTFGYETFKNSNRGIGKDNFAKEMNRYTKISKASHSSYVQIGAELGKIGFTIFLGILYCCLRTLFTSKTRNDNEERARRLLFTMLISFMISSWMVDFAYRVAFFLCVGAIAAYHRLLLAEEVLKEETAEDEEKRFAPIPAMAMSGLEPAPASAVPATMTQSRFMGETIVSSRSDSEPTEKLEEETPPAGIKWNRLTWVDVVLIAAMLWVTVKFWGYVLHKM